MKKKILIILLTFVILMPVINYTSVEAFDLTKIFNQGNAFWASTKSGTTGLGTNISAEIEKLYPVLELIGNLIFYSVAAILGVKYIWAGSEGKAKIKSTLPTYLVGFALFYLGTSIFDIFDEGFVIILGQNTAEAAVGTIWTTLSVIINIFAISGIIAIGLKYMYSDSERKAQIKESMGPMVIGIILVYSVNNVLSFLASTGGQLLQ